MAGTCMEPSEFRAKPSIYQEVDEANSKVMAKSRQLVVVYLPLRKLEATLAVSGETCFGTIKSPSPAVATGCGQT